jgi:sterol desaturase/sphingolipid hydroxylase (fatty acid hydroxylase superfamily)
LPLSERPAHSTAQRRTFLDTLLLEAVADRAENGHSRKVEQSGDDLAGVVHMLGTILIIILILILLGALPRWGYSSGWGYGPSGGIGVILIIVLILVLLGRL